MDPVPTLQFIAGLLIFGFVYYALNLMVADMNSFFAFANIFWTLFGYIWTAVVAVVFASFAIKGLKRMQKREI